MTSAKMPADETLSNSSSLPVQIFALTGIPEIIAGDNLAEILVHTLKAQRIVPQPGDVIVVAQKIVSKAEGRSIPLDTIVPSEKAERWAVPYHKDPRLIEIVMREASRIVRMERGVMIVRTRHGFTCANAGVDLSNVPEGTALLLPEDPDLSASALQAELTRAFGVHLAVIISDSFGRPWREGLVNVALGVAGMMPLTDYRGQLDPHGKTLKATVIAVADELAAAAGLVMGKLNRIPAAVIRGMKLPEGTGAARDLIRPPESDLFP